MKQSDKQVVDGPQKEYFAGGELSGEGGYRDGKRHGKWTFYHRNGRLKAAGKYVAGELDGDWQWWRENGRPMQAGAFQVGKQVGPWKRYYENGQLWDEGAYEDGKKVGEWKVYDKAGAPKQCKVFKGKRRSVMPNKSPATQSQLPLRITVVGPPPGVQFCVQQGRSGLVNQTVSTGRDISFDFTVRVRPPDGDGPPRLLGPFTQGPPAGRFVYVCWGTLAGQANSCWTRRAKVGLSGITGALVEQALRNPKARLEARFHGTAGDGGPSCATVRLLDGGWRLTS